MKPYLHLGISPAEFWRAAFDQSTLSNPRQHSDVEEEAFWQSYAPEYDVRSPLARLANEVVVDVIAMLQANDRLLEIGPGTGAFTRRLAPHVGSITGIEPSAAMRQKLLRHWPTANVPRLVAQKWEDSAPSRADVVFVANALYRVREITAALEKMSRYADRHVIIVQTVGRPHANPLMLTANGVAYERERADALCDVLDAIGKVYRDRRYLVDRGDEAPCEVALIDWPSGRMDS